MEIEKRTFKGNVLRRDSLFSRKCHIYYHMTDLQFKRCTDIMLPLAYLSFFMARQPPVGQGLLIFEAKRSHSRLTALDRTPLDE